MDFHMTIIHGIPCIIHDDIIAKLGWVVDLILAGKFWLENHHPPSSKR